MRNYPRRHPCDFDHGIVRYCVGASARIVRTPIKMVNALSIPISSISDLVQNKSTVDLEVNKKRINTLIKSPILYTSDTIQIPVTLSQVEENQINVRRARPFSLFCAFQKSYMLRAREKETCASPFRRMYYPTRVEERDVARSCVSQDYPRDSTGPKTRRNPGLRGRDRLFLPALHFFLSFAFGSGLDSSLLPESPNLLSRRIIKRTMSPTEPPTCRRRALAGFAQEPRCRGTLSVTSA